MVLPITLATTERPNGSHQPRREASAVACMYGAGSVLDFMRMLITGYGFRVKVESCARRLQHWKNRSQVASNSWACLYSVGVNAESVLGLRMIYKSSLILPLRFCSSQ